MENWGSEDFDGALGHLHAGIQTAQGADTGEAEGVLVVAVLGERQSGALQKGFGHAAAQGQGAGYGSCAQAATPYRQFLAHVRRYADQEGGILDAEGVGGVVEGR